MTGRDCSSSTQATCLASCWDCRCLSTLRVPRLECLRWLFIPTTGAWASVAGIAGARRASLSLFCLSVYLLVWLVWASSQHGD